MSDGSLEWTAEAESAVAALESAATGPENNVVAAAQEAAASAAAAAATHSTAVDKVNSTAVDKVNEIIETSQHPCTVCIGALPLLLLQLLSGDGREIYKTKK